MTGATLVLLAAMAAEPPHPGVAVGSVALSFSGYLQADVVPWNQASFDAVDPSTQAPLNDNRFLIRRARLGVDAAWKLASGAIELGGDTVGGPAFKLVAAELAVHTPLDAEPVPLAEAAIGLFRIPFGHDVRQNNRDRLFLEEIGAARALFPGDYDLGVQLRGGWRFLRYQLAIMNGEPVGEKALPGRDFNTAKDLVGRLAVVSPTRPVGFDIGFSGLRGTGLHPGTPATKDVLVWRDENEDGQVQETEIHVTGGAPATPSANFSRFGLGCDAQISLELPAVGLLSLGGELMWAQDLDRGAFVADPVAVGRELRELGFGAAVVQELPAGFVAGVRYDRYNPDADAHDQQGATLVPVDSSLSTWAFVGAWRYQNVLRLIAEFDLNRNALGRNASGVPTNLASNALTLRAEVGF